MRLPVSGHTCIRGVGYINGSVWIHTGDNQASANVDYASMSRVMTSMPLRRNRATRSGVMASGS